jgi:hypothetical protein
MMCFAKPGLPEDLYIVQKEEFSITNMLYMCSTYTCKMPSIFNIDKPIFLSERMLHKDYDFKGSVEKKTLVVSLKEFGTKTN